MAGGDKRAERRLQRTFTAEIHTVPHVAVDWFCIKEVRRAVGAVEKSMLRTLVCLRTAAQRQQRAGGAKSKAWYRTAVRAMNAIERVSRSVQRFRGDVEVISKRLRTEVYRKPTQIADIPFASRVFKDAVIAAELPIADGFTVAAINPRGDDEGMYAVWTALELDRAVETIQSLERWLQETWNHLRAADLDKASASLQAVRSRLAAWGGMLLALAQELLPADCDGESLVLMDDDDLSR
jgi:hypothetical protein